MSKEGFEKRLDDALMVNKFNLTEASLARIWAHHKNREFAIVTAWRAATPKDENISNLSLLKRDVRAAGYGYIPLEGIGQEESGPVKEPAIMVIGDDQGRLRDLAIQWGRKYDQFAIIYNQKGNAEFINPKTGETLQQWHGFHAGAAQFFSRHKGKDFHLEGLKYGQLPHSIIEGMGRNAETLWEFRDGPDWREKVRQEQEAGFPTPKRGKCLDPRKGD